MASASDPVLFAYLSYRDAPAGIAWMQAVGFDTVVRQDDDGGRVTHAELRFGAVVVMVAGFDEEYETPALKGRSTGRGLYLLTDDADVLFDKAVAAGGATVIAPESTEWGSRRARVLDIEGNEWTFGTYEPGRAWS